MIDTDAANFAKSVSLCSETLAMTSMLSQQKDWLGRPKLSNEQKGWAFGFCDGWAQCIGLGDDEEFILFISLVFERVWNKRGLDFFREILNDQHKFGHAIMTGGNAHHAWASDNKPLLMPR
ncbi:MAG: hypothetical protein JSR79_01005 [Proteobacteria bacterium]|nr:hypothetical protein [Pseudomonadota bacterium]